MKSIIIAMTCLLLSACTMPETKIYSLSMSGGKTSANARSASSVAVAVHSPRYLSQPYIAYRISPYQLDISRYSKWDSSPADIVRDAFRDALSSLFMEVNTSGIKPEGFYSCDINLRKFERADSEDGSFSELSFDVSLIAPDGKELYRGTVSKKMRLEGRDNLSLAKNLSAALAEGVEETKAAIAGLI